jgi:hypothetical protein
MLQEWAAVEPQHDGQLPKIWTFKELLSWKISDSLLSNSARESQQRLQRKQQQEGYICSYISNTHLYKLDLVTSRVKEQTITFVGVVSYVTLWVSKNLDFKMVYLLPG